MKQCPKCQSTYTDETLKFCLTDGTILGRPKDPPATLRMPSPYLTEPQHGPGTLSERPAQPADRRKRRAIYAGLVSLLILICVAIVLIFSWIKIRGVQGSRSGAATNGSTAPAKPATDILYADDFSEASLGNDWQVVSGDWSLKDGVLNGVSNQKNEFGGPVWAAVTLNRELPANYSVSFRTRIVDGEVSELMLHLSNNRYVRAYLYEINQAVILGDGTFLRDDKPGEANLEDNLKNLGGGPTVAQRGFPITKGTWYNVKVTAKDNTYTVSVGGQLVLKYVDSMDGLSKEGTVGLISNGHMQYDDLKILKAEAQ